MQTTPTCRSDNAGNLLNTRAGRTGRGWGWRPVPRRWPFLVWWQPRNPVPLRFPVGPHDHHAAGLVPGLGGSGEARGVALRVDGKRGVLGGNAQVY